LQILNIEKDPALPSSEAKDTRSELLITYDNIWGCVNGGAEMANNDLLSFPGLIITVIPINILLI
jgi:hypothetical protein